MAARLSGRAGRLTLGVLITAVVVLPAFVPATGAPSGTDGPLHAIAGAILASAYVILLERASNGGRWVVWGSALLIAVTVGVCVELGQSLIPGRLPSVVDALAHAGGAIVGLGVGAALTRRRSP